MRKLFTGLLFVLAFSIAAEAQTFYVATTGNDGNSCVQAQNIGTPKLTLASGLSCMTAGDTLIIRDGTYVEAIRNQVPSGSMGSPTIVQAENRNMAVVAPNTNYYALEISNSASYITFDGIVFDAANVPGEGNVVNIVTNASQEIHHITIQNGTVRNAVGVSGPFASGVAEGPGAGGAGSVHDNSFINLDVHGNDEHGFYISGLRTIVEGNRAYNNAQTAASHARQAYGIHVYSLAGGVNETIVRNNYVHDNAQSGVLLSSGSDQQFYNNIVESNAGHGIWLYSGSVDAGIYFNTVYGNTNTCIHGESSSGAIARNNICFGNGSDSIDESGGSITDSNNLFTDPTFVSAAGGNFHLTMGSTAIGAGVAVGGITTDLDGVTRTNPPDIGAYQFVAGGGGGTRPNPLAPRNLRTLVK